jgi:subtilisin family serine protease
MESASKISLSSRRRGLLIAVMCMATAFLVRTVAWSGEIEPELLRELESSGSAREHAVIIKMRDAVDYQSLKAGAEHMGRHERVKKVVQELRTRTERSQQPLLDHLDVQRKLGRIKKMKPFWIFNGIAVTATAEAIKGLASRADVAKIVPDRVITLSAPALASTVAPAGWNLDRIGVRPLWNAGYTGQGIVVATLDTGVDFNQLELKFKWRGEPNSWFDPNGEHVTTPVDVNGHGTQTMGIIMAGNTTDHLIGVAPGAQWIAAKIFNDAGQSTSSITHQAFQWVLDSDGDPNTNDVPDVVNCSWDLSSGGTVTVVDLEFQPDVQALRAAGIAVVFSAGNGGPAPDTSVSPANYPGLFSVGMTDSTDTIDPRSSRGPSASDGTSIYPSVVAPGAGVTTTDLWFGSAALSTVTVNGTSFSAPHAAGAMALLLSSNLTLTAGQMEDAIKQTAWDLGTTGLDNDYGNGFLDVERAARLLNVLPPAPAGDVDGNGVLDLNDVLIELKAAIGFPTSTVEMNRIKSRGDVYPLTAPDNLITPADALTLLRMYVAH